MHIQFHNEKEKNDFINNLNKANKIAKDIIKQLIKDGFLDKQVLDQNDKINEDYRNY